MKYAEVRNKIKSGDLLAWAGTCFQCRVVRAFTNSTYSHVGVAWVIGGRVFVLEAVTSGVRIYPLSREIPFYLQPTGALWNDEAESFALKHVGDKYSRLDAIKTFLRMPIKNDMWQCAEFAQAVLSMASVRLNCDATPEEVMKAAARVCDTGLVLVDN
jgi:uncharacterized protein YycO